MLYGTDREGMRRAYLEAWAKSRTGQSIAPLERLLVEVMSEHPEYHAILESPDVLAREFSPTAREADRLNPFLHMGLHIAVREQLATDRPPGLRELYARLLQRFTDPHQLEHRLMAYLGEELQDAQQAGVAPDETRYLARVRRFARRSKQES